MSNFMETENTITQIFPEEYFEEIKKSQEQKSVPAHITTGDKALPKFTPAVEAIVIGFHYLRKHRKIYVCRYDNLNNFDIRIPKFRILRKK